MGFSEKVVRFLKDNFSILSRSAYGQTAEYTPRLGAASIFGTISGPMTVAAVYRCVNFLAGSVANLPLQCLVKRNGIFQENTESRLYYLLNVSPNPAMSAADLWALLVQNLYLEGNAYIVPIYNPSTAEIESLVLPSSRAVQYDAVNNKYTVNDRVAGISGTFEESEILHFKNFTLDGKTGISTVSFARSTLDLAITGDRETKKRFSKGGDIRGIVGNDTGNVRGFGKAQTEQLEQVAKSLDERFSQGEKIVSLPGQITFNQLSMNSTDMQFLQSRQFAIRDICRWFGVHPSFVFDDTSSNYKSAEMANVAFLSTTLNPLLCSIEGELHRKLIAPSLWDKRKFNFDRRGLYACDLDSRVKYQTQTIAAGIYTPNEWRAIENKPAVEGGDTVLVSANLRALVPEE